MDYLPPDNVSPKNQILLVSVVLSIMFFVMLYGAVQMGMAYDENFHIPTAAALIALGEKRMVLEHPPFGHWLAGLSLYFIRPEVDLQYYTSSGANLWEFARRFFYNPANNYRLILLVARIPFIICSVVTALYVFLITRSLFGFKSGFTSLLLCAFCGSIIGWGRYVYLDLPMAFCIISTIGHAYWYCRNNSNLHFVLSAIFLALTCCAKYSGLIMTLPIYSLLFWNLLFNQNKFLVSKLVLRVVTFTLIFLFIIWACFGFSISTDFYTKGISGLYNGVDPSYRFYLMGDFKSSGWWYYFLVNLFIKLPLVAILLVFTSILIWISDTKKSFISKTWSLNYVFFSVLLFSAIILLVGMSLKALPLGSRYLLPCLPILYVFCGIAAAKIYSYKNKLASYFLVGLMLLHIYRVAKIFPDEMAYFNEFIGSPTDGIFWVNDASIDAGQNLPRLSAYLRERGNPKVRMLYQGQDNPDNYGIKREVVSQSDWDGPPSPGLYAISANWLVYGQLESQEKPSKHNNWLTSYTPIKTIGGSIWIYEFK
jgi:hypothetical protein